MNQQEIFDKVATHLIAQGKQSLGYWDGLEGSDLTCSYRGADGTMCAAGCLIPDDEYDDEFETQPWMHIWPDIPTFANEPLEVHELISALQAVHDDERHWEDTETLKEALRDVTTCYGLSSDVLNIG